VQSYGVLSLLPPFLAIVLAIITRNVHLSLLFGIIAGYGIIDGFSPAVLNDTLRAFIDLLQKGWVLKTLAFAVLVGSIIALIRKGGGVDGFVSYISRQKGLITSRRRAETLPFLIGLAIFIESSITSLIAGTVSRPLTDRFGTSREKLAYICDATSAPVCTMIPFNAWGALLLGLIAAQIEAGTLHGEPLKLLGGALLFNFYALFSILLVLYTIVRDIPFKAYTSVTQTPPFHHPKGDLGALLIPVMTMLLGTVAGLFISGGGDFFKGSGSTAVFWGVLGALGAQTLYLWAKKLTTPKNIARAVVEGAKEMAPVALILLLAFALGALTQKLGTGAYLARYAQASLSPEFLPAGIFVLSALTAFATGTSWGTFSIMIPVAAALSSALGGGETLAMLSIAAVISGGVFGDHASPISDTTIISAMAAGCDLIAHVRTQLPWALLAAAFSFISFVIAGIALSR